MPALRPTLLLLLLLHAGVPALAQPPAEPWEPGVRHLELSASSTEAVPELRITPGLALTLVFDTPVRPIRQGGVQVEGRERFSIVSLDEEGRVLTLVLSREEKPGKRLRLRVYFADGGVPAKAEFDLMTQSAQAETHVQVYRQPRSAEACCQEAEEERHKRQQCQVELGRIQASSHAAGPRGLIGLRAEGLMRAAGEKPEGVHAQGILDQLTLARDNALELRDAVSLQTAAPSPEGDEKHVRVAVLLTLESPDAQDWKAEGAQLTAPGGVRPNVTLWQSPPLKPGRWEVMVETELTEEQARGRFTLKLWDASGDRTFSVGGVTFP
jgi:uncharacterized protein (TIGR02268 family)